MHMELRNYDSNFSLFLERSIFIKSQRHFEPDTRKVEWKSKLPKNGESLGNVYTYTAHLGSELFWKLWTRINQK